ncbi:MAG: hypothetical protein KAW94_04535 [Candidatus Thorarchaeota archaeon]|nr:hypothetical protein [Candidatus Thorarchaeota archaeon]
MAKDKFSRDLDRLLTQIKPRTNPKVMQQLVEVRNRLVSLHKRRLVKINHSVMEVLCAWHLVEHGYRVVVEHPLDGGTLVADIYAVSSRSEESAVSTDSPGRSDQKPHRRNSTTLGPRETLVVEVETGFVPPEAALAPIRYRQARIAAKIARYSGHSQRFALATPGYHVLQVPEVLLQPPDERKKKELKQLKALCDTYYSSPSIAMDLLAQTALDSIYILNVDLGRVVQVPPHRYLAMILKANGLFEN